MRDGGDLGEEVKEGDLSLYKKSFKELHEDLFAVLLGRTEGEMHRRVINQGSRATAGKRKDGGGKAYPTVHLWYMDASVIKFLQGTLFGWVDRQRTSSDTEAKLWLLTVSLLSCWLAISLIGSWSPTRYPSTTISRKSTLSLLRTYKQVS